MDTQKNNYLVPASIIIAGIIIAIAIFSSKGTTNDQPQVAQKQVDKSANLSKMTPVTKEDHIKGNPNAPIKIVEYSDLECPFCKRFHATMNSIMATYGKEGKVAWVYRHFPLTQLHSKAPKEAEATECAAELGGNDKFWAFIDRLNEITPANNGLDAAELPKIAKYVGLDVAKFETCLSSGKYASKVAEQAKNAQASGGTGTPWSILVDKKGKQYAISGALPEESVKQMIEDALK